MSFIDSSSFARTPTITGSPAIVSDSDAIGGKCGEFSGSSQYLTYTNTAFLLSGLFTIEFRLKVLAYPSGSEGYPFGFNDAQDYFVVNGVGTPGQWAFVFLGGSMGSGSDSSKFITLNQFYDFAICRDGSNTIYVFKDGNLIITHSSSTVRTGTPSMYIGSAGPSFASSGVNCRLDEFRFTQGVCRYTGNYTPLSVPFPDS